MLHTRLAGAFFAVLLALCAANGALAQYVGASPADPRPLSDAGGVLGNQMRAPYRSDVGSGFTVQSLNAISMQGARARVGNWGQASANGGNLPSPAASFGGGGGLSAAAKPFTGITSTPTVSPYLNLFREDLDGSDDFNYQTLVRPQFQQLATNQQFQRQNSGTLAARAVDLGPNAVQESGRLRDAVSHRPPNRVRILRATTIPACTTQRQSVVVSQRSRTRCRGSAGSISSRAGKTPPPTPGRRARCRSRCRAAASSAITSAVANMRGRLQVEQRRKECRPSPRTPRRRSGPAPARASAPAAPAATRRRTAG